MFFAFGSAQVPYAVCENGVKYFDDGKTYLLLDP